MRVSPGIAAALLLWLVSIATGQVVEFESGGLKYQTLTREGVTIMFAHLPNQVRQYGIIQVAISNGSPAPCTVRPEDFRIESARGTAHAVPAVQVINQLARNATADDVIKLVTTYELGLYGMERILSTNGYEKRRQSALALVSSKRLKAAAAASAIALVETTLAPGSSTDGAVFYPVQTREQFTGESVVKVWAAGREFEFAPAVPTWVSP
jgi:hypothetical protein